MRLNLSKIRAAARANCIQWRYHALLRASQRGITKAQALQVVREGEIVEGHPRAKPYPKCLMMAMVEPGRPLYVSLAYDQDCDFVHIITVHWLTRASGKTPGQEKLTDLS